jgi:regulator of nucleoside diphosphate kinase
MKRMPLFISEADWSRLSALVESAGRFFHRDREQLSELEEELNSAKVVAPDRLPKDVVAMHSRVRVTDLDSGAKAVYTLSFPSEADIARDRLSVLAPIGTVLLGRRQGSIVRVRVPRGRKRLKIDQVLAPLYETTAA